MGGHFTRRDLVCAVHNGLCGKWADGPLCEQFAFAVHALEVLKGDRTRGTTWTIAAEDGTRFDVMPDFRFRMHHTVERPDGGFRITATDDSAFRKIGKQLATVADLASTHDEVRRYDFVTPVSAGGPGKRGVLKAALHFVATLTSDRERARAICREFAAVLFSDTEPANVQLVPYELGNDGRDAHRHELLAWVQDEETLVRTKVFNVATYLVRLPRIPLEPTVYRQSTRDGSRTLGRTLAPHFIVDEVLTTPKGFQKAFAERVDALVLLASYKSDIADVLREVVREPLYRMMVGEAARERALNEALRERMRFRDGVLRSWMAKDIVDFAERMIAQLRGPVSAA